MTESFIYIGLHSLAVMLSDMAVFFCGDYGRIICCFGHFIERRKNSCIKNVVYEVRSIEMQQLCFIGFMTAVGLGIWLLLTVLKERKKNK